MQNLPQEDDDKEEADNAAAVAAAAAELTFFLIKLNLRLSKVVVFVALLPYRRTARIIVKCK